MSKLFKTCVIKPWAGIAHDPATSRKRLTGRIIILTLLLSIMLVIGCGPNTPSSSSSSPDTNSPLATGTTTPTTAADSKQRASSTTTPATPTTAVGDTPGSNPLPAASTPVATKAPPDQSNPPTGPTTVVEADPSSFTVTIHEFDPTVTAGQKSQPQTVELDNADPNGIINWSVLIEMFDGKDYGWLSVSSSGGTVPSGKQGQPGISNADIIASVPSTMPPGDYKGCVEFLPPSPQDHCVNDGANAFDEANKEVYVKLTVAAATSTPTSQPVAPPTPTSQQPVAPPTPTSQPAAPPTPTSQPVAPPTPTSEPVAPPTPTSEPVAPPTPTSEPVAPPTSTST